MNRLLLAALAASMLPLGACVIDLSDLTGGARDGGGGAAATSSAAGGGSAGTTGSGGGSGPLDCASCPNGGCAPQTVVSGSQAAMASGIAVTGEGLYWTSPAGGALMRLAASGGPPSVLAKTPAPTVVAVSGGGAAWVAQMGVYVCSVASCGATTQLVHAMTGVAGVAYDGQDVYYTEPGPPNGGSVVMCPPNAGCHGGVVLGSGLNAPGGIGLYKGDVFWTEQGNGNQNGNVDLWTQSGGLVRIASALQLPSAVAADDVYVYWTEADPTAGKVRRCPYAGGFRAQPQDLATGLAAPIDLALDLAGGRVYWIDQGDGRVLSCPVAGCVGGTPRVHATGRTGLQHVAVGASCVFWTDDVGGGSVSKAAL